MEQELNIAAILKDKPNDLKLYDVARDINVFYGCLVGDDCEIHCDLDEGGILAYNHNGTLVGFPKGMQILKPSMAMQDWSKFAWKKGDVVVSKEDGSIGIFDAFTDNAYTKFNALYYYKAEDKDYFKRFEGLTTLSFKKVDEIDSADYVKNIEGVFGGKLNLETLEIEKPEPQFKDGDIVSVIDCYSNIQICIVKSINKNKLEYYASTSHIVEDWLNIDGKTVCLSLESEKQQLFDALAKEGKRWNSETKTLEDLPKKCELKPFDKVLVRDSKEKRWDIDLFKFYRRGEYPYICLTDEWQFCIPYNEQTAHLLGTTDD